MLSRAFLLAGLALVGFAACQSPYKESDKRREEQKKDASNEPNFQAFVGRLRTAVRKKDHEMLQSLMAPDFGYRWDNPPPGDSVFTYWDMNNLWPELSALLDQQFVVNGDFMVAPPELAANSSYAGYRVGLKQIGGSWKFVYFVGPPPPEQAQ
jgi:hypothetical protein